MSVVRSKSDFNTTLVQLKEVGSRNTLSGSWHFNTTLVQLKVKRFGNIRNGIRLFQYYLSSIKRKPDNQK